jgi:hypothetical protein
MHDDMHEHSDQSKPYNPNTYDSLSWKEGLIDLFKKSVVACDVVCG